MFKTGGSVLNEELSNRLSASVRRLSEPHDVRAEMAQDVRKGMTSIPRTIPSRYIYDQVGSELFEQITQLPEYYLTRAETEILANNAPDIMRRVRPDELIELGSGSSTKTRLLLEAMHQTGGQRYVPIDISETALITAAEALQAEYPWLEVEGNVGDYHTDLHRLRRRGGRLLAFLGSTIGNHTPASREELYGEIAASLETEDALLLGADLVKEIPVMVAAYDDRAGVTARFTQNVLRRVNTDLGADFPLGDFSHVPRWNAELSRMEAWLRAERNMRVEIADLDLAVELEAGEEIHTEVSYKFTKDLLNEEIEQAGMAVTAWYTDTTQDFALLIAQLA